MHKDPLVSVIIPTFNRAHIVDKAITSVCNQTYKNWECLVVDDGSQDKTDELIETLAENNRKIKYFKRNRMPKGAPTCRNIGIAESKGEYIIFLDSDDYLLNNCIENRVKIYNNNTYLDFIVFPMAVDRNGVLHEKNISIEDDYLKQFLSANLPWQTMCPIWNSKFIKDLSGFTEGYKRFNDPELMIRALLRENCIFKVCNTSKYDCVLVEGKQSQTFPNAVYDSLQKFIPDISSNLVIYNKVGFIKFLSNYLHLWFKYIAIPSKKLYIFPSIHLIWIFYKYKTITTATLMNLYFRLLIFLITSSFGMPVDKLSERAIY